MEEKAVAVPQKKPVVLIVILAVLAVGMLVSIGLSVYLMQQIKDLQIYDEVVDYGPTQENDVTIADEYVIRATTQISDAYISGDSSSLSDTDKETLQMASDVLDSIITDGMSDFEKEKAVYDWMCANLTTDDGSMTVIPTTGEGADTPYGVLKNRQAICVGYATTFRLFMQMMNINCMVEHNTECYHSWDLVQLDGDWYITDIYSDVGSGNYAHFNMTDEMWMNWGEDWDMDFFPSACSLKYNIAYQTAEASSDVYALPAALRKALDDGDGMYSAYYANLDDADQMIADDMLMTIQDMLWNSTQWGTVYMDYSWAYPEDGGLLMIASITREEEDVPDDDTGDLTQEQLQKADDAISGAFGDIMTTNDYLYDFDGVAMG